MKIDKTKLLLEAHELECLINEELKHLNHSLDKDKYLDYRLNKDKAKKKRERRKKNGL